MRFSINSRVSKTRWLRRHAALELTYEILLLVALLLLAACDPNLQEERYRILSAEEIEEHESRIKSINANPYYIDKDY